MRLRPAGGLDLAAGALIVGGAALVAASIVAAVVLLAPLPSDVGPSPTPTPATAGRRLADLPADRVAVVLAVDVATAGALAARPGDHVDVLGYFSPSITGAGSVTRVLVQDAPVLALDRSGASITLTLAVPQDAALLLQEAQALGARPSVTLLPAQGGRVSTSPQSFSDADLAARLAVNR